MQKNVLQAGLVEYVSDADGAGKRRETACRKGGPPLIFEIEGPYVDVAGCMDLHTTAQHVFKVGRSIWVRVAAGLKTEVAGAQKSLCIYIDALMAKDITRTDQVRVLTDVGRCIHGVVNFSLETDVMPQVEISVEGNLSNFLSTEVGTGQRSPYAELYRTETRSGRNRLTVCPGRHAEDASETPDKSMPLQLGTSLGMRKVRRFIMVKQSGFKQWKSVGSL